MQLVTRDFNTCHHYHRLSPHSSERKRILKRAAHHRARVALRNALAVHDWETAHHPVPVRPATGWDIT